MNSAKIVAIQQLTENMIGRRPRSLIIEPCRRAAEQRDASRASVRKDSTPRYGRSLLHCGISTLPLSALGQKRTQHHHGAMSALPPKADKRETSPYVCFVPKADERAAAKFLIRSPRGAKWSASH